MTKRERDEMLFVSGLLSGMTMYTLMAVIVSHCAGCIGGL